MTIITDLREILKQSIANNGPMSIAEFMAYVLNSEMSSYYKCQPIIGKNSDFITAPEISQLFGEIIGIWCANYWMISNKPKKIRLIEFGPGRGTLMADLLRSTLHTQGFHDAIEICLVEINPYLRREQEMLIQHPRIKWFEKYSDVPQDCFSIIVANEFFDALPINQYIKRKGVWYINMVDLNRASEYLYIDKNFTNDNIKHYLTSHYNHVPDGGVVELNDMSSMIIRNVVENLKLCGGAMLVIDYGYTESTTRSFISTLQSIKNHKFNNVFEHIGSADITAHVNFSSIAETAELYGGKVYGPISQRQFLQNMHIEVRKDNILRNASCCQRGDIVSGYKRLIDYDQMGELFKVMAISDKSVSEFIGF